MGNCAEYILSIYAAAKIGAIAVVLNPAYTNVELEAALLATGCKMFITSPSFSNRSHVSMIKHLSPNLDNDQFAAKSLRNIVLCDPLQSAIPADLQKFPNLHHLLNENVSTAFDVDPALSEHDVVNLQFTSGTTGLPKAASLTSHNILNNGLFIGQRMDLTSRDKICIPPPLFHCFGLVLGCLAVFTHGAAAVFASEVFNPLKVLQTVQSERCTGLHGVPTMFIAEMEHPEFEKFNLTSLRTGIAAGSSVPSEIMHRIHQKLHLTDLTICYGMTETSPVSTQTTTHDPIQKRIATVGRLLPHTSAKIVDPATNQVVPIGESGELCVSGYLLMKGYWNDAERTAEVTETDASGVRWMHTGDEAVLDADGYFSITGRIKDLIIRGGENIAPLEIEDRLMAMPQISQASVIGIKDDRYGEVVGAFIALSGHSTHVGEAEVRAWVGAKLARYKIPKYIFWMGKDGVPETFPCTASGKIRKIELRQLGNQIVNRR